ncbi:MAG: tryptophan tryptophylquinone biosynthesis enzyme MauG [Rhodoferax sp.]|nr:tryptophan tryptophylquinone biosynthesis enzyme MauG [Rhodoferax sp.]
MKAFILAISLLFALLFSLLTARADALAAEYVFQPGHPSLAGFLLGDVPHPADNQPNAERIALGQRLFFDPRLSRDGTMSCATCHHPGLGWADALPTARGDKGILLDRATPTVLNTAYNSIQMWDGRKKSLEDQAPAAFLSRDAMDLGMGKLLQRLQTNQGYQALFAKAYPGEPINEASLSKALASFERTLVSKNSAFDQWVRGDANALSAQQVEGFKVFVGKGGCVNCHSGGNFTDNDFHNVGLASWGRARPDKGRYAIRPVDAAKGAFKTPTLREVARTAPYFHDGSAATLLDVVELFDRGGVVAGNLSPRIQPLHLSQQEKLALVAFMESLSSAYLNVVVPELPAR